jgi:hypothetical protein
MEVEYLMRENYPNMKNKSVSNIIAVIIMIVIITSLTAMYFTYRNTTLSTDINVKNSIQLENLRSKENLKIYANGSDIIIENIGSNPSYIDKIMLIDNNDHVLQIIPIGRLLIEGSSYTFQLKNNSVAYLKVITNLGNIFTYFITKFATVTISVTPINSGTTNPNPGVYLYPIGKNLTLSAVPSPGYRFNFWILNGQVIKMNQLTIQVINNASVIAVFSNTTDSSFYSSLQDTIKSAPPAWLLSTSGTMTAVMYMTTDKILTPQNVTPAATVLLVKASSSGYINVWIPPLSLPNNVLVSITTRVLPFYTSLINATFYPAPILYPIGGGYLSNTYWSQYGWLYMGSNAATVIMNKPGYANFTIVFYYNKSAIINGTVTGLQTGDFWIPIYYSFQNSTGIYTGTYYYFLHIDWGSSNYPNGAPLPIAMIILRPGQIIDMPIFSAFQSKYKGSYIIHPYASWGNRSFTDNIWDYVGSSLATVSYFSPIDPRVNLFTLKLYYVINNNQKSNPVPQIIHLQLQAPTKAGIYYYTIGYPVEVFYSGPNTYPRWTSSLLFIQFMIIVLNNNVPMPNTAADAIEFLISSGASGIAVIITPQLSGFPFGYSRNAFQTPYATTIILTILQYGNVYLSNLEYNAYYTLGPIYYWDAGYWIAGIGQEYQIFGYTNVLIANITGSSNEFQFMYKIGPSLIPNRQSGGVIVFEWKLIDNNGNIIYSKNVMG